MPEKLFGFIAEAETPYFACFRKPASTSVILTYPVPPFTTLVGMIANALGISRLEYFEGIQRLQSTLWLNLRPLMLQRSSRESAKILKLIPDALEQALSGLLNELQSSAEMDAITNLIDRAIQAAQRPRRPFFIEQLQFLREKWQAQQIKGIDLALEIENLLQDFRKTSRASLSSFPSSPMHKYFLPRPGYRFFVASRDAEAINEIVTALNFPKRPLYLGQSDDMVVVTVVWKGEVEQVMSQQAYGLVRGSYEGDGQRTELLRLPIGFESERKVLLSPLLTLPSQFPFQLPEPEPLWRFDQETVHLFSAAEVMENASGKERTG